MSVIIQVSLDGVIQEKLQSIKQQMESRAYKGANELRNASLLVLRGQRSGREYRVPGTKKHYTASAPGEPPAVRTGVFRLSWKPTAQVVMGSYFSRIESDVRTTNGRYTLGQILEEGTPGGKIKPRPHHDKITKKAEPKIRRIYDQPYF